jgi:hypothetical protein
MKIEDFAPKHGNIQKSSASSLDFSQVSFDNFVVVLSPALLSSNQKIYLK